MDNAELIKSMREFGEACKRAAPAFRRLLALHAAYEAERAAALFEGRVPPSPEVFYAEMDEETARP